MCITNKQRSFTGVSHHFIAFFLLSDLQAGMACRLNLADNRLLISDDYR